MKVNAFARMATQHAERLGQRLVRSHANCPRTCRCRRPLLYAMHAGQTALTDLLALLLLGARLFQSAMHPDQHRPAGSSGYALPACWRRC